MKRFLVVAGVPLVMAEIGVTPALAHDCTNASKDANAAAAGVQIVVDTNTGDIEWASAGVQQRIANGTVDPSTGETYFSVCLPQ